ncbi:MAG: GUN4 domain-containing protein [Geitlerinemataceae cyanobacterium]
MDWRLIVALAGALAAIVSAYIAWKWERQNLQESRLLTETFPTSDPSVSGDLYSSGNMEASEEEELLIPEIPEKEDESLASDVPQTDFGDLASDIDADYTKLRDFLAAENYKAADLETRKVMVWVCRTIKQVERHPKDSLPFPCNDLKTIDRLWIHYSEGRFGFSVQKEIYTAVDRDYQQFGDRVGWRKEGEWLNYHHLQFDLHAPKGHLPRITWVLVGGYEGWKPQLLARRCFECDL